MKLLLAVDGSEPSLRATRKVIETIGWYKEPPTIDLVHVHLPVPRIGGLHAVVGEDDVQRYYAEESASVLSASVRLLDRAGVRYSVAARVGAPGETIVHHARRAGCDLICMGTHARPAGSALVFGSVAMEVVRLAPVPVMLVR